MSAEAATTSNFIREITRELHNHNVAIFVGAGLSIPAGYVDWKALLKEIIEDLKLDPKKEHDLVTVAQYSCNQKGGSKTHLSQTILDHFSTVRSPTENHRILARLPIETYWTTNYDKLLEDSLKEAQKIPDVKYSVDQLATTRSGRHVTVYKMHGDIDHPASAIISKDDYESYPHRMAPFVTALKGDLVEKTFLFLGLSFTDPNIDYILSRVRVQYERNSRHHYCILKKVSQDKDEDLNDFKYKQLKQDYFIADLKRFGILSILVEEYTDITRLLGKVEQSFKRSSVFISGAAEEYGQTSPVDAQAYIHNLSKYLAEQKNRIITGFGIGVGSAVINGALAHLSAAGKTISDEDIVMRPFPQIETGGISLQQQWQAYRREILKHAGVAIFIYGNKKGSDSTIINSDGMQKEFQICIELGVRPIPIGITGYMAKSLWVNVIENFASYYPTGTPALLELFKHLGDEANTSLTSSIQIVADIINILKKE